MQDWHYRWAIEALRVAKPGCIMLAFGGTRTHHRLACAIEDAGWEIRDTVMWVYGSGFPKSLDISKAIDKAAGAEREVVGVSNPHDPRGAAKYRGDSGIFATGRSPEGVPITAPATDLARLWQGWGTALKPAWEPIIVAMKPLDGTFAQNAERHGVAGLCIDGCRVGTEGGETHRGGYQDAMVGGKVARGGVDTDLTPKGRWPANLIHDGSEEVLAGFPVTKSGVAVRRNGNQERGTFPVKIAVGSEDVGYNDTGSAARFFQCCPPDGEEVRRLYYCAKASRAERELGLEGMEERDARVTGMQADQGMPFRMESGVATNPKAPPIQSANHHPTVKPLALMRYLVRLTKTPTGGLVLDPFMGSGTTGVACVMEGRDFVGIELSEEYCAIARARIAEAAMQGVLL
jgi:site-specific DNA-methyltransferase (adenine-specific)